MFSRVVPYREMKFSDKPEVPYPPNSELRNPNLRSIICEASERSEICEASERSGTRYEVSSDRTLLHSSLLPQHPVCGTPKGRSIRAKRNKIRSIFRQGHYSLFTITSYFKNLPEISSPGDSGLFCVVKHTVFSDDMNLDLTGIFKLFFYLL